VGLEISEYELPTAVGAKCAMVITPRTHIRVGFDQPLDESTGMSATDQMILREARARRQRVSICVFRGASQDGEGSWAFAEGLDEGQGQALAQRLLPGQVAMYRGMLKAGISLFVHADWGAQETDAFRFAVDHRIAELREGVDPSETLATSTESIDLWLLRNLTFFFTLSFEKLVETILPDKLVLMEKRMERIRRLAASLPHHDGT
jgi:hypothetical protein